MVNQLRNAVDAASDDDGWASLATVGHILIKQRSDFDSRSYGYAKLSELLTATTLFELDHRRAGDGKQAVVTPATDAAQTGHRPPQRPVWRPANQAVMWKPGLATGTIRVQRDAVDAAPASTEPGLGDRDDAARRA